MSFTDPVAVNQIHFTRKELEIAASMEICFASVLEECGPAGEMPGGKPFAMTLEAWPGGRWFRDLGNNSGHFWGVVQVIKPPTLLEITGPLAMSYPAQNFVQYRLTAMGNKTKLAFAHHCIGLIPQSDMSGFDKGWGYKLERTAALAERRAKAM